MQNKKFQLFIYISKEDFPDNAIIVSHSAAIKCFLSRWYHWSVEYFDHLPQLPNCHITVLEICQEWNRRNSNKYILREPFCKEAYFNAATDRNSGSTGNDDQSNQRRWDGYELERWLTEHPEFAGECGQWDLLPGDSWERLLHKRPQLAPYCDWEKMDGKDWSHLLRKNPEFSDNCDWSILSGDDWARLLWLQPQFADKCECRNFTGEDWFALLRSQPRYADKCNWSILSGNEWRGILYFQPQFGDKCDWSKLSGEDWSWLLSRQPQFSDKCDWGKFAWEDWEKLLEEQPQFMDKFKEAMSYTDNLNIQKNVQELYEAAHGFAAGKHRGQTREDGKPYITHPEAVAERFDYSPEKVVAILHDVLEDTDATEDDLRALGLEEYMLDALRLLTHEPELPYMDYVKAIAQNPIAKQVKLADLKHNLSDIEKLAEPRRSLLRTRYRDALEFLEK